MLLLRQAGQTLALPDEAPPTTMGGDVIFTRPCIVLMENHCENMHGAYMTPPPAA